MKRALESSARTDAKVREAFASDIRFYLTQMPRQLPSRYFYDALGSALFEAICQLPWYPLTQAELRLLKTHAAAILDDESIGRVIELGAGSGEKLASLLAARRRPLEVHLVDVSATALQQAESALEMSGDVRVTLHEMTYEAGLEVTAAAPPAVGRTLLLFLGSNIGNFDPPGREAFLRTVRASLRKGDGILLGADLVKPEPTLLLAYDDPLQVTAAFNRNLLVRINRELQGEIDLDGFAHRAVWNAEESRVEMHLVSLRRQRMRIPGAEVDFEMNEGETIWTESSYKFDTDGIADMLQRCGFKVTAQWVNTAAPFALTRADCV